MNDFHLYDLFNIITLINHFKNKYRLLVTENSVSAVCLHCDVMSRNTSANPCLKRLQYLSNHMFLMSLSELSQHKILLNVCTF